MNVAHHLRRWYWRVVQPTTLGSRCLVVADSAVLLVRHTYWPYWYLPGGGVKRGESFAEAARREIREECGLKVHDLKLFHIYHSRYEGKSDHVALFVATAFDGVPQVASPEIAEIAFAPITDLPLDTSPATRRRIREYLEGRPTDQW